MVYYFNSNKLILKQKLRDLMMRDKLSRDAEAIQKDYAKSKINLGFIFFMVGCFIPYLLGDRHDQFGQLFAGFIFSIIGACIAAYVNRKIYHRIVKSYGYKYKPWWQNS